MAGRRKNRRDRYLRTRTRSCWRVATRCCAWPTTRALPPLPGNRGALAAALQHWHRYFAARTCQAGMLAQAYSHAGSPALAFSETNRARTVS